MSRRSFCSVCVFVAMQCVPAHSQEQRKPTPEDLNIMVSKWTQLAAPDQLLSMDRNIVIIFERDDIKMVVDAGRKGNEKNAVKELVAKGRADIITSQAQVRLLDTFQVLCFAFNGLDMRCPEVQETLRGLYVDIYSITPLPPGIRKEKWARTREDLQRRFITHDLSNFIEGTYALVRVVSGGDLGVTDITGWVPLDQLRPLSKR